MADDANLDTEAARESISATIDELEGEVESTFDALIEPLNDLNETLESKFLKRFLVEFGKLKVIVSEKIPARLADCRTLLEEHDAAIEAAFEELVEEEEG